VVPFGFDFSEFLAPHPDATALRNAHPGRRIFALGRHVHYKGFDVLIKAMAAMPPDVRLALGGEGPETARLRKLAADLGVEGRVHFPGFIPQGELPAHFQACDVFCLPSITPAEAFGIVQVEAMACGKPVVSTRLNNGVDFVNEDGKTGLTVPPGDPAALAKALLEVLDERVKAAQWGAAGKAKALAEFPMEKMTDRILEIYRSAVGVS
jgi:rhamnosyl/mannosyltransferase